MFKDRAHAAGQLAKALTSFKDAPGAIVLGLPRGGALVADVVARRLRLPWDVFISQKVAAPWDAEVAIGAVTELGNVFLNEDILDEIPVPGDYLDHAIKCQGFLAHCRQKLLRGDRHLPAIEGRTLLVVDDGIATGATFLAAVRGLRDLFPSKIVAAVPVALQQAAEEVRRHVDSLVVLEALSRASTVSASYERFEPVDDRFVIARLARETARHSRVQPAASPACAGKS